MQKVRVAALFITLLIAAIACGGGDGTTASNPPVFAPKRIVDLDELPFSLLDESTPFVFNNKAWVMGIEKPIGKMDCSISTISIWSSPNCSVWTKVAEDEDLPWDVNGHGGLFVFNRKAWFYGSAKTGGDKIWRTSDFADWAEVADLDTYPFDVDFSRIPIEFAGKSWWIGAEKTVQKSDWTLKIVRLWSTADLITFQSVAQVSEQPMDIADSSLFVFNRKYYVEVYQQVVVVDDIRLYSFAYPNSTNKLDYESSDAYFYNTLNGISWSRIEANPYTSFRMAALPAETAFYCIGDYLVCIAQYVPYDGKCDASKVEEGMHFWRTKDAVSWVRAYPLSSAEFALDDSAHIFTLNNAIWAHASTRDGIAEQGRFIWKITR